MGDTSRFMLPCAGPAGRKRKGLLSDRKKRKKKERAQHRRGGRRLFGRWNGLGLFGLSRGPSRRGAKGGGKKDCCSMQGQRRPPRAKKGAASSGTLYRGEPLQKKKKKKKDWPRKKRRRRSGGGGSFRFGRYLSGREREEPSPKERKIKPPSRGGRAFVQN